MAQIISFLASIVIAVAIFYVIGEIRRETLRSSERARSSLPLARQAVQIEASPAAVTPSND